jgi:hypothetical protein
MVCKVNLEENLFLTERIVCELLLASTGLHTDDLGKFAELVMFENTSLKFSFSNFLASV